MKIAIQKSVRFENYKSTDRFRCNRQRLYFKIYENISLQ